MTGFRMVMYSRAGWTGGLSMSKSHFVIQCDETCVIPVRSHLELRISPLQLLLIELLRAMQEMDHSNCGIMSLAK